MSSAWNGFARKAQKSFCSNKLSIIRANSERTCWRSVSTSKGNSIKETSLPQRCACRIGPRDSYENCFWRMILTAFILFVLTKRFWRSALILEAMRLIQFLQMAFLIFIADFKGMLERNSIWTQASQSLAQLWPCTINYIENHFISRSWCVSEKCVQGTAILLGLTNSSGDHLAADIWNAVS